ncbi:MAG: hypothetical protein GWO20_15830 [Candidatus Korarchaeota archaeon]|nr:hypothetical protein [Candidatus Korarchaeota archaeon]NIU84941.1 hypothetical protein [Candidatus Thorarchaeota archaeon]NIW14958.1 hypothetical protein [Candidatus Thorarchaeota archaeon]NIW52925.1 hypothetical protein [Candidatus Korarchaeota archaeon]
MKKKVVAGGIAGLVVCSLTYVTWIGWFANTQTIERVTFGVSKGFYGKKDPVKIWVKNERNKPTKIIAFPSLLQKLTVKGWKYVLGLAWIPEFSVTVSPDEKVVLYTWDEPKDRGMYRVSFTREEELVGKDVYLFFSVI